MPFKELKCQRPEIYDKKYYDLPFDLIGITKVFISPA
jgi:hypothetical protein